MFIPVVHNLLCPCIHRDSWAVCIQWRRYKLEVYLNLWNPTGRVVVVGLLDGVVVGAVKTMVDTNAGEVDALWSIAVTVATMGDPGFGVINKLSDVDCASEKKIQQGGNYVTSFIFR